MTVVSLTKYRFVRDRSLFIVQEGIEEKLGGPLNFFKPVRRGGGALKKYRETKEGGL